MVAEGHFPSQEYTVTCGGGNNNKIFRIMYRLLILHLFSSFSHRCVAPAVVFSNGRPDGHAFARFTVLFAYAHIHTEVTCIDLNRVCPKHDQMTQTERKDHTSNHRLTHKNFHLFTKETSYSHITEKGLLNTALCCPAVGACFDWQLEMGGTFSQAKFRLSYWPLLWT